MVEALKPREGGLRAGTEEVQRRDEAAGQADGPGGPGAGAHTYSLDQVNAGYDDMRAGRTLRGVINFG